jgi:drug/metabolite transporter (DMT)-like permease
MTTTEARTLTVSPGRGTGLVLLSSVCFATSGPLGRAAMNTGLSPLQVASARICIAAVALLAVTALVKPALLRISRAGLGLVVAYGLLGVTAVQVFYFLAVSRLPVGVALLLEYLSPVVVTAWVRIVRRTALPRAVWLGVALAVAGLVLVGELWHGGALSAVGLIAGLATCACSAAYFLLGERGANSENPIGMTVWGLAVGAVAMSLISPLWTISPRHWTAPATLGHWQVATWSVLLVIALLSTIAAYVLGMAAMRHLPPAVVSVLALAEPVVSIVLAWVLLGQALSGPQLAGGVLILAGATVVQLANARRARALRRESRSARSSAAAGTCPPPSDRPPGAPPALSDVYR